MHRDCIELLAQDLRTGVGVLPEPSTLSDLLGEDNGDGIVENAFSKHQHVEHRVHVQCIENCNSGYWVDCRYQGAKCKTARREARADSVKHVAGPTELRFGCDAEMAAEGPTERVCFPTQPCSHGRRGSAAVLCMPGFPAAALHPLLTNAAQKSAYPCMYCPALLARKSYKLLALISAPPPGHLCQL